MTTITLTIVVTPFSVENFEMVLTPDDVDHRDDLKSSILALKVAFWIVLKTLHSCTFHNSIAI